jgi:tripartite-type tricarboxylate transporter receptor subunit TctC
LSQIQGGTIEAIAIPSPERADVIKDVPTTKEGGLPDFQASGWNAIFAPRNLPQDIQAKLSDALVKALDDPAIGKRLLDIGCFLPHKAGSHTAGPTKARGERSGSLVVSAQDGGGEVIKLHKNVVSPLTPTT